jgi:hypothetical protein
MRTSRVFRTIWRLNGVLILLAFVLVGGMALLAATTSAVWSRPNRAPPAAVMPVTGEKLFFGSVETVDGSSFVLIPLEARRPGAGFSSGSSHVTETRNLLFYDASSGVAHWLRPDHSAVIVNHELLRESGATQRKWDSKPSGANDPVRWVRYDLATADTNGDGQVDVDDVRQIAVSGPDGKEFTIVLERIDDVLGYASPESGKLVVFFRRGDSEFAGEISLSARKLVRTVPLPKS